MSTIYAVKPIAALDNAVKEAFAAYVDAEQAEKALKPAADRLNAEIKQHRDTRRRYALALRDILDAKTRLGQELDQHEQDVYEDLNSFITRFAVS